MSDVEDERRVMVFQREISLSRPLRWDIILLQPKRKRNILYETEARYARDGQMSVDGGCPNSFKT